MTSVLLPSLGGPRAAARPPAQGLSSDEAREKRTRYGPDVLAEAERAHWLARFARNFTYLFALLLWMGAGLAWLGHQPQQSVAIVAVIVVNAVFSFARSTGPSVPSKHCGASSRSGHACAQGWAPTRDRRAGGGAGRPPAARRRGEEAHDHGPRHAPGAHRLRQGRAWIG